MKLNKKMIDRLESSIRKIIDNYEPFVYGTDDVDLKFIKIDPYILWNRYQSNYTINLFYIFNKFLTYPAKNMARQHGLELIKRIKIIFPILEGADYDIHMKTKNDYKKYEDELIPQVRNFLPESRRLDESVLPFKQTIKNGVKTRVFSENIDDHELKWHRDERPRIVEVVKGSGWKFQMDNELPRILKEGDRFKIPSETFHRVIKGNGDLIIKIKEL